MNQPHTASFTAVADIATKILTSRITALHTDDTALVELPAAMKELTSTNNRKRSTISKKKCVVLFKKNLWRRLQGVWATSGEHHRFLECSL